MCLRPECKYIEIVAGLPSTIFNTYIHYDGDHNPLWIDYMGLEFDRKKGSPKPVRKVWKQLPKEYSKEL